MTSKFNFFENVCLKGLEKEFVYLNNKQGCILGMSEDDKNNWYYSVVIENGETFSFKENELESLGTFAKREDYYSGESIRIGVTKEGKGYIIEDEERIR